MKELKPDAQNGSPGTYDVVPAPSYKCGWKLRRTYWVEGKRHIEVIPVKAWLALGFTQEMNLQDARARASQINAEKSLEINKARKAALRALSLETSETALLPKAFVDEFSQNLLGRRSSSDQHKRKLVSHWKYLKKMILDLQIKPEEYADSAENIYDYFVGRETSLEYSLKLIGLMNRWGAFYCKKTGKFFEPVPNPKGKDRSMIADTYSDSQGFRGESDPLTPALLEAKRSSFSEEQYRWLFISVWFGLRPQEINLLKTPNPKKWRIEFNEEKRVDVLWVYQPKLTAIEKDKRWKPIPIIFPQQKTAVNYINEGKLKAPLYKTMKTVFTSSRITLYGGRKGFMDLMLDNKQTLENIATWLGHQSIEMTWTKYRNKKRINFNKP